jgi:branched-chain amino acid transport system permease protein
LTETLRIWFGTAAAGWDILAYGTLLVLFVIFLPQGLLGSVLAMLTRREVVRHD